MTLGFNNPLLGRSGGIPLLAWACGCPILSLLLLFSGCYSSSDISQTVFHGNTMGTTYTVKLTPSPDRAEAMQNALQAELDAIDSRMSTYRADSELSRFNALKSTDWFEVSPETAAVVDLALQIGRRSGGAHDVTVEPLVRLWNFGSDAKDVDAVPSDKMIEQALQSTGLQHLFVRLNPPALKKNLTELHVDLSSIAKGYAVDRLAELLDRRGCPNYMIEVGGEVRVHGQNAQGHPWQIAIERPTDGPKTVQRVVPLHDQSMATSGDYRNYFEKEGRRYSHLIDPRSGKPVAHRLASATVLADTCAEADGWATALMVLGPEDALAMAEREGIPTALLLRENDKFVERCSSTFPAKPNKP